VQTDEVLRARVGFWGGLALAFLIAAVTIYGPNGLAASAVRLRAPPKPAPALSTPFAWRAERAKVGVHMDGHVPSAEVQQRLRAKAHELFPAGLKDDTTLAAGVPTEDWPRAATAALVALAQIPDGEIRLTDKKVFLSSSAPEAKLDPIKADLEKKIGQAYALFVEAGDGAAALPELAGIKLAGANAEECQSAFSRVMAHNVINFETNSAEIAPASSILLDGLASLARRCDGYSIEVAGHTDDSGEPALNQSLSLARARAVVDYLISQGVSGERLTAKGYGAASPVASNATEDGRAQNRRIEFSVRS
jgi:OmpA-OmpF porin, OOP family